ncbi:hypothetical protein CEUSTIGMA_g5693.t1 [Chlamydomonas eustigma]|uniref:Uncharacterized protein n=1 Tax=Chlamydomonas eustigma TaxID=1157962 RepID=A0A250X597_9CHLO|nr:hypothetical protein CEUSTIGMA_g5693.t1 [Chlamydomonas eustigma]|eukprot:GAX78251.1 hypothetical protein CEUSTIGMA_g5693.t1 [Chlamydomonas eustigma]
MLNLLTAFVLKNQHKLGYTLIALSIAIAAITYIKPVIDEPNITEGRKQLFQASLVFILVLLFGIVKNLVWFPPKQVAVSETPAIEASKADKKESVIPGNNGGSGKVAQSGKQGRRRSPKA